MVWEFKKLFFFLYDTVVNTWTIHERDTRALCIASRGKKINVHRYEAINIATKNRSSPAVAMATSNYEFNQCWRMARNVSYAD